MKQMHEKLRIESRRGNTALWLLVGLVAVGILALLVGLWLVGTRRQDVAQQALAREVAAHEAMHQARQEAELEARLEDPSAARGIDVQETVQPELTPQDFEGRGTIAGRAHVHPASLDFPESWTLILEPSRFLQGSERAAYREIPMTGGETDFKVEDLPLGGYSVRSTASEMNGIPVDVLLAGKVNYQYVQIRMTPTGFIDGGVTNTKGEPLEGVRIVLESVRTKLRRETTSDIAGNYLFEDVADGEYRLWFGSPDNPLLPVESLIFKSPSLRFPTREISHDGEVQVVVVDSVGSRVPGATIRGFGTGGGQVEAETDSYGIATLRFLPAGRWRITATRDLQTGRARFELGPGEQRTVEIPLGN